MKSYKGWSKETRYKNLALLKKAQSSRLVGQPCKCQRCGQTEGIIQFHCEDYDASIRILEEMLAIHAGELPIAQHVHGNSDDLTAIAAELEVNGQIRMSELKRELHSDEVMIEFCWRCHMMHHSRYRAPYAVDLYFKDIAAGMKWPPVFKHDFKILLRDHGVK